MYSLQPTSYALHHLLCIVVRLRHLKYLDVSNCELVDDWCLDRFIQFRDTLLYLDISGCPLVTENGLACLHKLKYIINFNLGFGKRVM